jgi:raffinose/stachyose/melibiose transport system substrate-binding protein
MKKCPSVVVLTVGFIAAASMLASNAQQEQMLLKVASWQNNDPTATVRMNELFLKANPDIKLEMQSNLPFEQYGTSMNARLVAGDAPDVLMSNGVDTARLWQKAGYLADFNSEPWLKNLIAANRNDVYIGTDKAYQFVISNIGVGLFYNKQLLDDAGVTVPSDYPQFLNAMQKIKASGKTPLALGSKLGWGPLMLVMANAVNTVYRTNPNHDRLLLNGSAKFDSAGWRTVMQRIVDWSKAGYFDARRSLGIDDFDGAANEFAAGRAAFHIYGSWQIAALSDKVKGVKFPFGFQSYPGGPSGSKPRSIVFAGNNWVLNAKSKVSDAARRYIRFWADNIDTYLQETGGNYSSLTTSKYSEVASSEFAQSVKENRAAPYFINNWNKPAFQDAWYKVNQALLLSNDVDAAVKSLDTEFNKK